MKFMTLALVAFAVVLIVAVNCYAGSLGVTTDKPVYGYGEAITVSFSDAPGLDSDWICIVPEGSPDTEGGDYKYLPKGLNSGTLNFNAPTPGRYEVRTFYNYNKIGYVVASRSPFLVTGDADDLASIGGSIPQRVQFSFSSSPFTEVLQVNDANADELYYRAREWFSKAFNSANNVLQMDSKERMILVGKGGLRGT